MKKIEFSKEFKIIVGFLLILLIAVVSSVYHIDFNNYLNKFNKEISNSSKTTKKIQVELVSCVDGDTAKFKENGIVSTYRFLGINTKEYTSKKEKYGYEASIYTCNRLENSESIYVSYEKTSTHYDDYNRRLVWVYVDDKLLQEELLKKGLAEVKYVYTKLTYLDKLYKSENIAKKKRLNIFKNYKEKIFTSNEYTVLFRNDSFTKEINVIGGNKIDLINNPKQKNKTFKGWSINGKLYDLSTPVKNNLILDAMFE